MDEQIKLSRTVILEDAGDCWDLVAGVDVAYGENVAVGAGVVMNPDFEVLETATSSTPVGFPYIPGFFSLRELNPALSALSSLSCFDLVMVNGHGRAHPRKFGLASHLGVRIKKPALGVTKNLLVGRISELEGEQFIVYKGERVGAKILSPTGSPVYVSSGHMISLGTSIKVVRRFFRGNVLPEPLTQAHILAREKLETLG